jgi:hypothetical protein
LKLRYRSDSDGGQLVVWVDGTNREAQVGGTLDQYRSPADFPTATLGPVTFTAAGDHRVRLVVVGQNPASRGFTLSADTIILE